MADEHQCDPPLPGYVPFRRADHGLLCECRLLAAATHSRADAITFSYCRDVLQRRYAMTCRHGEVQPVTEVKGAGEKWHDCGEIDAVKAILVNNS